MSSEHDWPHVPLGSMAEFRNGLNYNKDNFGSGLKVINVKDFGDLVIPNFDELDEINPEGIVREDNLIRENDIVFVRSNGNRELIGRSLFITDYPEDVSHSAFTIRVRFTSKEVVPRFYAYLFRSPIIRRVLTAHGGGTNISNLNQRILHDLQVPLPTLEEQRKIASVLSTYDDLIENNTRRIEILEEMAQAIYREWFVNFRFPGHENVGMVDSELGLIPEGWAIRRVKGILKRLKAGNTYKEANVDEEGQVPVVDQSRNDFLGFHNNAPDHVASPQQPIVIFGDHTCKMQLMVEPFSVGPNVVPFVSRDETPILFLYFLVDDLVETREYKRHWTELTNKRVVLPPISLANMFSSITTPLFEYIHLLTKKNLNLRHTRDLLLPKLISGELAVEEHPNSNRGMTV